MTWPDVHYKKLTVPAWVECRNCGGFDSRSGCLDCNMDGGKWHEGICNSQGIPWSAIGWGIDEKPVTKSTILYQLFDPCGECGGKGWTGPRAGYCGDICPFCLKDSDGNPTGAAEGTGQGWKIEE